MGGEEEVAAGSLAARCDFGAYRHSAPHPRSRSVASAAAVSRTSAGGASRRATARAAAARSDYFNDDDDDDPFMALDSARGGGVGAGRFVSMAGGGAWRTVQRMRPGSDAAGAGACSGAQSGRGGGCAAARRVLGEAPRRPVPGKQSTGCRLTGVCGTPNCNLRDFHCGPCEPELALSGRKRSRQPSSFRDWGASDEELLLGREGTFFGSVRTFSGVGSLGGAAGVAGQRGRGPTGRQAGRAPGGRARGGGAGNRSPKRSARGGGAQHQPAGGGAAGPWEDVGRRLGGRARPEPRDGWPANHHVTSGRPSSGGAGGYAGGSRPAVVDLVSPAKPDPRAEWLCGQCGLHNLADGHECNGCGRLRPATHNLVKEARCFDVSRSDAPAVPRASAPGNGEPAARPRLMRLRKRAIQDSDEEEGDAASPTAYDIDEEY